MRKMVTLFTLLLVLLSLVASFAGVRSYGHDRYRTFTTAREETVEVQEVGVYRYSVRALVTGGMPWDFVRLFAGIPVLVVSFVLYLRGSMRGTVLFIGSLASFLYQYLLWTFAWAYNALFLVYVASFSLSLWTLVLVLADVERTQVRAAIDQRFPVKLAANFSFALGGMLLIKCLGEILPALGTGAMPAAGVGYYTMVDQALDIGLLTPFCAAIGVLLLRRESLGYLLSASSLVLFLTVGLSVIAGEVMLGLSTGQLNVAGLAVFGVFMLGAMALLAMMLTSMNETRLPRRSEESR